MINRISKYRLNWNFVIGHWVFTLLFAPFIAQAIEYIFCKKPHQIAGLVELYPITLLFSIFFSLPTVLIYLIIFLLLSRSKVKSILAKSVLISISVIGIYITQMQIGGSMTWEIITSFSVSSIIIGLFLKYKVYIIVTDNSKAE